MNKELKKVSKSINVYLKDLINLVDNILGKYKLENTEVYCKPYFKYENTVRWVFIIWGILYNIKDIFVHLHNIYLISTINESEIDDIVKKMEERKGDRKSNYITLKCHKKRMCCLTSNILNILWSAIMIILYLYLGVKCRLLYGLLFYYLIVVIFAILYVFVLGYDVDDEQDTLMCPMPSEYMHLFGFGDKKEVQKEEIKYQDKENGYYKQF